MRKVFWKSHRILWVPLLFSMVGAILSLAETTKVERMRSFTEGLREILERSTEIQKQSAALDGIRVRNLPKTLFYVPTINGTAKRKANVSGPGKLRTYGNEASLSANLNLFRFGSDFLDLKAASLETEEQTHRLGEIRIQVERTGTDALINYIQKTIELEVVEQIIKRQSTSLDRAKEQFKKKKLSQIDLDRILIDSLNSQSRLWDTQIAEVNSRSNLEKLLGHSKINREWPWQDFLSKHLDSLLEKKFDLTEKPQWRATTKKAERIDTISTSKYRRILPSLDANYSWNINDAKNGSSPNWEFSLTLTVPIFDRLQILSEAASETHNLKQAEYELEGIRRNAQGDYIAAKENLRTSVRSAMERERTLKLSKRIYENNFALFQAGKLSANDLIIDQNRLSDSELFTLGGWASAHRAFVQYCHSLGHYLERCLGTE